MESSTIPIATGTLMSSGSTTVPRAFSGNDSVSNSKRTATSITSRVIRVKRQTSDDVNEIAKTDLIRQKRKNTTSIDSVSERRIKTIFQCIKNTVGSKKVSESGKGNGRQSISIAQAKDFIEEWAYLFDIEDLGI